jgi:hypothetical protein
MGEAKEFPTLYAFLAKVSRPDCADWLLYHLTCFIRLKSGTSRLVPSLSQGLKWRRSIRQPAI